MRREQFSEEVRRGGRGPFTCAVAFAALFASGCGSTLVLESGRTQPATITERQTVFVRNPELEREYAILRNSGIYQLTDDKSCPTQVTLSPIRQYGRCANPLLGSIMTLGILPGFLPAARSFAYDMETAVTSERFEHPLPLAERYSIWEWLIAQDKDKVTAKALALSDRRRVP